MSLIILLIDGCVNLAGEGVHALVYMWRSEDSLLESVLSYYMGLEDQTQITRFGGNSSTPETSCKLRFLISVFLS